MWCETMTSPERMGALMRGEKLDRVPVIPFIFGHTALICGEPLARMYDDAEQSFRCQLLSQEMYGYDGGPLYGYASAGAWEFGGDIEMPYKKYQGAPVVTRTPIESEEDALNLKVPDDVSKAGAYPIALGMARIQAKYGMPILMHNGTPFSQAGRSKDSWVVTESPTISSRPSSSRPSRSPIPRRSSAEPPNWVFTRSLPTSAVSRTGT